MQTVPVSSLACVAISCVVSVGLPIVLAVVCARRRRGALRAVLMGALCFVVGAQILEGLCHQLVFTLFPSLQQTPAAYILYACLAAGLFEETARLVGLRRLCRRDDDVITGFAYGVGHGGIEAILVAVVSAVSNLSLMLAVNNGQTDALLAGMTTEQAAAVQPQIEQLAALPPMLFLASGVERVITIAFHIALSMIIWMVVTGRLPRWGYAVAVLLHAGMDVFAGLNQTGLLSNVWILEAAIAVLTALVCAGVWQTVKKTR